MKTNEEILEQITSCTIDEDADLDVKENFYYKYEDVIKAMNEVSKQVNGTDTSHDKVLNLADVTAQLPSIRDMFDEGAGRYGNDEKPTGRRTAFIEGAKWMRTYVKELIGN